MEGLTMSWPRNTSGATSTWPGPRLRSQSWGRRAQFRCCTKRKISPQRRLNTRFTTTKSFLPTLFAQPAVASSTTSWSLETPASASAKSSTPCSTRISKTRGRNTGASLCEHLDRWTNFPALRPLGAVSQLRIVYLVHTNNETPRQPTHPRPKNNAKSSATSCASHRVGAVVLVAIRNSVGSDLTKSCWSHPFLPPLAVHTYSRTCGVLSEGASSASASPPASFVTAIRCSSVVSLALPVVQSWFTRPETP
mmetsp:Transcript_65570/g.161453  ORF Transcript_65570/g.161453 Transcript_65570/m.161453 type:complete len:251 (-) Transcript_65570:37-789(-)